MDNEVANILVVDDMPNNLRLLSTILTEQGHSVRTLRDGRMVLASVLNQSPDLILLDISMPEMDGFEVCQQLKAEQKTRDIPVIFVSAFQEVSKKVEGFEHGGVDYITKPFEEQEVLARVNTQLKLQSLRKNIEEKNKQLEQEIVERKKIEKELRQAATVFDNTDEGILITDAEKNILTVNKAYKDITGYELEEVMGKNPRLHQSGRQTTAFYQEMWETLNKKGQWRGEMWNRRKNGELYPAWVNITAVKDELGNLTNYVSVLSDISVLKESEERMVYLAHHDALTGLPNRLLFGANLDQSLERAKRYNHKVAVLFLDLDRFKTINDTLGHDYGDKLLQKVAEVLKQSVRAEDTVARFGGDEFVIILNEITKVEEVALIAQKIINTFSIPIKLDGQEITTGTSIGISIYPDNANNKTDLLKAADSAMYKVKEKGRGNYQFCE